MIRYIGLGVIILTCRIFDVRGQSSIAPQLIYPADEDTVSLPFQGMSWQLFGQADVSTVRLVEVAEGQTPRLAILQNPPVFLSSVSGSSSISYPSTAQSLTEGKRYAWVVSVTQSQIVSDNRVSQDISSPVATFVVASERKRSCQITLHPKKQSNFQEADSPILRLADSTLSDESRIWIRDVLGRMVVDSMVISRHTGDAYPYLDLQGTSAFSTASKVRGKVFDALLISGSDRKYFRFMCTY